MRPRRSPINALLLALVLTGGLTTMAVEMAGSRLLAPFFGNSLLVWANLIGLIMVYLTAGYYLGGSLGDRHPSHAALFRLSLAASLAVALVPLASRPVLSLATAGFIDARWGLLMSSFAGVLALFAAPMVLLGCISPYAIRLSVQDMDSAGRTSGRIYALSTMGSILGTFLPTFLLIPSMGTRSTFFCIALLLGVVSLAGLLAAWGRRAIPYVLIPLLIAALWLVQRPGSIKPVDGLVYERESAYNYIQVVEHDGATILKLNEGEGNQSIYRPDQILLHRVFDYFLAAPFFRPADVAPTLDRVCVVGLAGGTMAYQYTRVYGDIPIDGVEIDPELIEVARDHFGLTMPNVQAHAQDGRYFLHNADAKYDVIILDAYKPPYIPFHLTTVEFFQAARERLSPHGVVAVNAARTENDMGLVDALASTMLQVYGRVYVVDSPESYNSMIVGTTSAVTPLDIAIQLGHPADPLLANVAQRTLRNLREYPTAIAQALRDDRAPVEQIIHGMILRFALGG